MPKLPEFLQAENELDGNELVYIAQNSKTRKTTLQKIKEFIIGTAALLTTDKTPTGAINELKDGVDNLTESVSNNTTQLNDIAIKESNVITTLPLSSGYTATDSYYVKFKSNLVKLVANITGDIPLNTWTILFSLPVGYRPYKTEWISATVLDSGNSIKGTYSIQIQTNGNVYIFSSIAYTGVTIKFNNIFLTL